MGSEMCIRDRVKVMEAVDLNSDALIWRGTTANGRPGHPIVVSRSLFGALSSVTGDNGGSAVLKTNLARTHFVTLPGDRALCDLDTPEEWAAWRAARNKDY